MIIWILDKITHVSMEIYITGNSVAWFDCTRSHAEHLVGASCTDKVAVHSATRAAPSALPLPTQGSRF